MRDRRLFFALRPGPQVRSQLVQIQRACRQSRARLHRAENLHVTLAFLGMVDQQRYQAMCQMASRLSEGAFTLELDHTGYWRRPGILWCAPTQTPAPLAALVRHLWEGLERLGFEPEQHSYRPHVTLMRKAAPVKQRQLDMPVVWPVSHFELMCSHHREGAHHYETLNSWPLQ
ncbi:MAG: RNA 2',3'-cyclic phosphodiesterase [Pseudomonadota bacterium]